MQKQPIRALVVASVPEGKASVQMFLGELKNLFRSASMSMDIVGIAYNKRTAIQQLKQAQPDFLLIDLMLPGMRSIEIISLASATQPGIRILALTPGDPPHDRVIMAAQAGALGFISKDVHPKEVFTAAKTVLRGDHYLPLEETFDVLQQAAPELIVSVKEKRAQFVQALLAAIPLVGITAAFTEYLWREYWGQIGVRVVDLGVDASSRVAEFLIALLVLLGVFGPVLFINTWRGAIINWINQHPRHGNTFANGKNKGRVLFLLESWIGWFIAAAVVLTVTIPLQVTGGKILTVFLGAVIGVVLLANFVAMDDVLPVFLKLPKDKIKQTNIILGGLILLLMFVLSAEVFLRGPDLRPDGLHGIIAPRVLDLSARPVMIHDLNEKLKPLGALYLGGNADLYVLYDPFKKTVRFVPVGSSRVEFVDKLQ